jgi:hypothetical protein
MTGGNTLRGGVADRYRIPNGLTADTASVSAAGRCCLVRSKDLGSVESGWEGGEALQSTLYCGGNALFFS